MVYHTPAYATERLRLGLYAQQTFSLRFSPALLLASSMPLHTYTASVGHWAGLDMSLLQERARLLLGFISGHWSLNWTGATAGTWYGWAFLNYNACWVGE